VEKKSIVRMKNSELEKFIMIFSPVFFSVTSVFSVVFP